MSASTTAAPSLQSPMARRVASKARAGIRRPVAMAAGDLLRIVDAPGTRIVATSGVLWVTEERSPVDVVLRRGERHRIREAGVTLVEAHRPARLIIEVPHVARMPAHVELAFGNGRGSRLVPLPAVGVRAWGEWLRHALVHALRVLKPAPTLYDRRADGPRKRGAAHFDPSDYTPEGVRDRLLRSSSLPRF